MRYVVLAAPVSIFWRLGILLVKNQPSGEKMRVLVVAGHPDDEALGCGGTLLKHKKDGDEIFWLIITKANIL